MNEPSLGSDGYLIEYAQMGDRSAFDLLVRKYERKAFQYALRLCNGNRDDASDVTAEAFLRVYINIKSFRKEATFTTWLFRVITNVFLDLKKRQKVRSHESLEQVMELDEGEVTRQFEDHSPGPEMQVETSERNQALMKAVSQLPDYQKAMIVLYHIENQSYEEIAAVMNLPLGTVKSRLNRARLALKDLLSDNMELFQ